MEYRCLSFFLLCLHLPSPPPPLHLPLPHCLFRPVLLALLLISCTVSAKGADLDESVVTLADAPITLPCSHSPGLGAQRVNWLWKPHGRESWSLVHSANQQGEFYGGAMKPNQQFADQSFLSSGNFSLVFQARDGDGGRYSCEVQTGSRLTRSIVLLVILTVWVSPPGEVPIDSTVSLGARVSALGWEDGVSWFSPQGLPLHSEPLSHPRARGGVRGVLTKLPRVDHTDQGNYTCQILPQGNCTTPRFLFTVTLRVSGTKPASFNITYGSTQVLVGVSPSLLTLPCVWVAGGDYVMLFWRLPDTEEVKRVFLYDRWRGTLENSKKPHLHLARPNPAQSGDYSFLLTLNPGEGGEYSCEVFLDERVYRRSLIISVMHVWSDTFPSMLVLHCVVQERTRLRRLGWRFQDHSVTSLSTSPGQVSTELPLPPPPALQGNYTCCLELQDGQVYRAVYTVTLTPAVLGSLLLLVASIAMLLWKRGTCRQQSAMDRSLSFSPEGENLYEDLADLRQECTAYVAPEAAVYMDLKPNNEDVYKELERNEKCCS
ncbi:g6f-like isoform X2 [Amia ocellicauda]|uniref:g6f-like isoform X2 n=1 Tax=Amia ocellicauda TaxID=2972642 RepID=UPI0034638EFC